MRKREQYSSHRGQFQHPYGDPVADVRQVIAIPLPAGNHAGCVHTANPLNWRDYRVAEKDTMARVFRASFELWVGIVEQFALGTPHVRPALMTTCTTYAQFRKKVYGKVGPRKDAFVNALTLNENCTQFHPSVAEQYRNLLAMRYTTVNLDEGDGEEEEEGNRAAPRPRAAESDDDDDDESESDGQPALRMPPIKTDPGARTRAAAAPPLTSLRSSTQQQRDATLHSELSREAEPAVSGWQQRLTSRESAPAQPPQPPPPPPPEDADPQPPLRGYAADADEPASRYVNKLQLVVTPVHASDGAYAGAILFILVRDPNWNAGAGVMQLIRERTLLLSKKAPDAMRYRYEALPSLNVLLHIVPDLYTDLLCRTYTGEPLRHDEASFDRVTHPAHPATIWTVERALAHMRTYCAGDVSASLDALHPHRIMQLNLRTECQTWTFPANRAYAIDQRHFYWANRESDGLAVQYLPWESGDLALARHDTDSSEVRRALDTIAVGTREDEQARSLFARSSFGHAYRTMGLTEYSFDPGNRNWCVGMGAMYVPVRSALQQSYPAIPAGALNDPALLGTWLGKYERYAARIEDMEHKLLQMYNSRIWQRDARLTPSIAAMVRWHHGNGTVDPGFRKATNPLKIVNRHAGLLGNYLLREGAYSRHGRRNVTCSEQVVLTHFGVFDAYRYQEASLHWGELLTGPPQASKSHVLTETQLHLIPGTVDDLLGESTMAGNADEDRSDHITIYDEMPWHMMGGKDDTNGHASRTKSSMTTGKQRRRVLELLETATGVKKRMTRVVTTYMIGVIIIASNIAIKDIESAIVSRLHHISFTNVGDTAVVASSKTAKKTKKKTRGRRRLPMLPPPSVNQTKAAKNSTWENESQQSHIRQRQVEQLLVANVYKAIQTGCLPEPNMDVCDYVVTHLLTTLQGQGVRVGSYRKYERTHCLAMALTIVKAVLCAFHNTYGDSGALHAVYEPQLLRFVKPYLCCGLEEAVFAFTITADQYLNPLLELVLRAAFEAAQFPLAEYEENVKMEALALTEALKLAQKTKGEEPLTKKERRVVEAAVYSSMLGPAELVAVEHDNLRWAPCDDDENQRSLNYIVLRGGLESIAHTLRGHLVAKPSVADIISVLRELCHIMVATEEIAPVADHELANLQTRLKRTPHKLSAARIVRGRHQGTLHICVDALAVVRSRDIVRDAIRKLAYQGMAPTDLVLGTMDEPTSGIFHTLELSAADCAAGPATFRIRSGDYMDTAAQELAFDAYDCYDGDDYESDGELRDDLQPTGLGDSAEEDAFALYDKLLEELDRQQGDEGLSARRPAPNGAGGAGGWW